MQIISTIRKGHTMTIAGCEFRVMGSNKMRGEYYYILARKMDGAKSSITRKMALELQPPGTVTVTA